MKRSSWENPQSHPKTKTMNNRLFSSYLYKYPHITKSPDSPCRLPGWYQNLSPEASWWGPHLTQLHNPIYSYLTLLYQGYPNLQITYPYTPVHTPCSDRCKIGVCGVRCILAAFWGRLASECSVREMPFQWAVTHLPRCGTLRKNSYQVPETHLFSILS